MYNKIFSFLITLFFLSNYCLLSQINCKSTKLTDSSIQKLDSLVENKQIILIGENSHGDGFSVETRFEIVKYLQKKHGFNTLIFESGLYETNRLNDEIKSNLDINSCLNLFRNTLPGMWSYAKEYQPMFNYIINQSKKDSIIIGGMDCQINAGLSDSIMVDFERYLAKINLESVIKKKEWYMPFYTIINNLIKDKGQHNVRLSKIEEVNFKLTIDSLKYLINKTDSSYKAKIWVQVLKGYQDFAPLEFHFSLIKALFNYNSLSLRDSVMANNINWIIKSTSNKVIIWAHSAHILKKIPSKPNYHTITYYLNKKYNYNTLVFHTTAAKGEAAPPFITSNKLKINNPKKNSYEKKIFDLSNQIQILTQQELKTICVPNKKTTLRICNYKQSAVLNPLDLFDVLIFFPEMKSATMIEGGWNEIYKKIKKNK